MEQSVLERQTAMLRRVYQSNSSNNRKYDHHHQQQPPYSVVSDGNNSGITRSVPFPNQGYWQCNSSFSDRQGNNPNKRKAEIDDEDNGVEAEEAAEEKSDITMKNERERETSSNTCSKADYIHVRARRGQATDSHSLAERARREKISKKMKCLQDLVPGCNKVIGKAGMLDEIINYVQSLQKQVEFLSMKIAAVNPRLDFSVDNIYIKEIPEYIAGLPPQFEAANSTCSFQYNPTQQSSSNCGPHEQSQNFLQKAAIPEMFLDSSSIAQLQQQLSEWESDWQSLFTAGFH